MQRSNRCAGDVWRQACFGSDARHNHNNYAGGDAPGPSPATTVALNTAHGGGVSWWECFSFAEPQWGVIRKVDSSDSETVVAGVGALGYSGDGGPATSARTVLLPGCRRGHVR